MSHTPSFSQPRPQPNTSGSGARNPYADSGGASSRNGTSSHPNSGAAAAGAGASNRNQSQNPNAAAAAAGAGAANRNQSQTPNAGAAAAGAGAANRSQSQHSNAGAAAAGAGAANRNQSQHSNAGAAAAGAGYANRNQSQYPNAGAAAAGAGYANRNQNQYPYAGAAAAGATYANRNQYDQYHPGMSNGYWNGNYGASAVGGYGGIGAWGVGSPAYGYGYSAYSNPYTSGMVGGGGSVQPGNQLQPAGAPQYDYSQPLNTVAAPPDQTAADQASAAVAQAREAFKAGDYSTALQLTQQALGQMPNDTTLHEFLGLVLFAQGSFEQAAAPLYAVLSVGPGWDWTTLSANYPDNDTYTRQLRGLEAYVRANPKSAKAQFVLAYHYISQGHGDAAIQVLENVVALQPNDTLSPQLLSKLRPASASPVAATAPSQAQAFDAGKLTGTWVAQPQNAKITLTIKGDGTFDWAVEPAGKQPMKIQGEATVANGVLTLSSEKPNEGSMAGNVAWQDDKHFVFRAVGAPSNDPGLQFAR
jgi:hypothetical protein